MGLKDQKEIFQLITTKIFSKASPRAAETQTAACCCCASLSETDVIQTQNIFMCKGYFTQEFRENFCYSDLYVPPFPHTRTFGCMCLSE